MPEYSTELRAEVDAAMAAATKAFPVTSHETPDYAEITFGSSHTRAMSMEPDTLLALNGMFEAVPLLTAHIDAQAERIAELERDLDALSADLAENASDAQVASCEGCGAPLFEGDDFVSDEDSVAGCWFTMTDAPTKRERPCYAYRVGKKSAAIAKATGKQEG